MGPLKEGGIQEVGRRVRTFWTRNGSGQKSRGSNVLGRVSGRHGAWREGSGWGTGGQAGVTFRRPFHTCGGVRTAHLRLGVGLTTHWTFRCWDTFGSFGCGTIEGTLTQGEIIGTLGICTGQSPGTALHKSSGQDALETWMQTLRHLMEGGAGSTWAFQSRAPGPGRPPLRSPPRPH